MRWQRLITRSWFYLRVGYGTYLSFPIGVLSTVTTIYYLAIQNISALKDLFPHFTEFMLLAFATMIPLAVAFGYAHQKRMGTFKAEQDINIESNPWNTTRVSPNFLPIFKLAALQAHILKDDTLAAELEKIIENTTQRR